MLFYFYNLLCTSCSCYDENFLFGTLCETFRAFFPFLEFFNQLLEMGFGKDTTGLQVTTSRRQAVAANKLISCVFFICLQPNKLFHAQKGEYLKQTNKKPLLHLHCVCKIQNTEVRGIQLACELGNNLCIYRTCIEKYQWYVQTVMECFQNILTIWY